MQRLLAVVGEEGNEEIMTAADQLMERGRKQGHREILLDLLRQRFGVVPDATVVQVRGSRSGAEAWLKSSRTPP